MRVPATANVPDAASEQQQFIAAVADELHAFLQQRREYLGAVSNDSMLQVGS